MTRNIHITLPILISVLALLLFLISGETSAIRAAEEQDMSGTETQRPQGDESKLPNGVIGLSLHVGAERIGDPASLYVARVHPVGPAQQAGLKHGDELVTVNGEKVTGKTYEQVIKMVRGEAGTSVKLGLKVGEDGVREVAITRIAGDKLYKKGKKGDMRPHGERDKKSEAP